MVWKQVGKHEFFDSEKRFLFKEILVFTEIIPPYPSEGIEGVKCDEVAGFDIERNYKRVLVDKKDNYFFHV